jgi:lantibiotic modifying enzyme
LTGDEEAARLAVAGMSTLRHNLRSLSAARLARGLGTGGANGMGSVVYTLTVLSELLGNEELLADAQRAASLFTGDVVTADRSLDVMDGSAGGILGLLKLYRATKDRHVLDRAMQCGEHLLSQRRFGTEGHRSWVGAGVGDRPLNGMSHWQRLQGPTTSQALPSSVSRSKTQAFRHRIPIGPISGRDAAR